MDGTSGRVPVERGHTESRDLGEVEDLVTRRYINHRPRVLGRSRNVLFRSQAAWVDGVTVDRMTYAAPVAINVDPIDTVVLLGISDGRFGLTAGREHGQAGRDGSLVCPPGVPFHVFMDHVSCSIAQLPVAALTRLAGRFGIAAADFRFDGVEPVSPAMNRYWLATAAFLARSFAGPDPAVQHPLILAGVVEVAAAAVLAAFPNTTMRVDYTGPGRVAPATVRRAVAYIDAHAGRPITIEDVAAASGIKARGLQAAFARHRGMSPTGYLRRVRMERAHRDLQNGDRTRGDTVAAVARRWGFAAPGRFAVEYRRIFGRSPGETLEN